MPGTIVKVKVRFQDGKEFNGIGCRGDGGVNQTSDHIDYTAGSSVFPFIINSVSDLPFEWESTDIDNVRWHVSLINTDGNNYRLDFTYGGLSSYATFSNTGYFPLIIVPYFYIKTNNTVSIEMHVTTDHFHDQQNTVRGGSFYNNNAYRTDSSTLMTTSEAISEYLLSISVIAIAFTDIKESGAIRWYGNSKGGNYYTIANFFYFSQYAILGSYFNLLQAITYEGYTPQIDISTGRLELSPTTFYYDGNEHLPTATLYDAQGNILLYGTDWGISYSPDRTNPGQKIALAYGQGNYTGEITANWWILDDNNISGYTMNITPNQMRYTGSEQTPIVTIYDRSGNLLVQNVDYTLELSPDRITIGQKYARATGIGNYTGTLEGTWAIFDSSIQPYMPGGETVPSTGPTDGTWTIPEDEIAPSGTIFSDLDAQLYRPYAMTAAQVASFSNQLWNTSILDVISRYFEKPTDVVIALMSYPFEVQSTETASQIAFNWITDWSSVYVTGHAITQELQTLDFGYIDIDRYSGTFYDYQPYSSVQLYLPYIGFVPLKMNEILGRRVYLKYIVDVITGDFSAIIETSWPDQSHEDETTIPVIATYQGNLAKALPLSQQDMFSIYKTAAHLALAGATAAAAGIAGFAAAGEAGEAAVAAESYEAMGESRLAAQAEHRAEVATNHVRTARRVAAGAGVNAMYAVGNANLPIIRNGNIDGISGRTSMQEAFVIISVPDQNVPGNQGILGYPTNLPGPLSNYAGYTEVRDIRIKSATATEAEIAEIEQIVRGGIIV